MSDTPVLTRRETAALLRLSLPGLRRQLKAGTVPAPLRLEGRRQLWSRAHIEAYLAPPGAASADPIMERIDARRQQRQAGPTRA